MQELLNNNGHRKKEKLLLLTICVGDAYEKIAHHTHPTLMAYADRIGADFKVINESDRTSPHWEKFRIYDLLNTYHRILYLDTDISIRDDCPNLFDIVPKEKLGAFNEAPFTNGRQFSIYESCKNYDIKLPDWNWKYYNSGVLVISRMHKQLFIKPDVEIFNFYEQGYLNVHWAKEKALMFDLPYIYNRMCCMDPYLGEDRHAAYVVHYAGFPSLEFVLSLIPQDLARWEQDRPGYQYRRHILFDVQGGLGDQVQAEPAIRFALTHVWPGADLQIKTHFPRLFQHLGLPTYTHEEWRGASDTPYYHAVTLPGLQTPQWAVVSNLLCHTIDFCSMAVLKRTLPVEDKQVRLDVRPKDLDEVEEVLDGVDPSQLILVHPGRHFESKTLPQAWWQEVVLGLCELGLPVCLIGQDDPDGTRGVLDFDCPPGAYDARNCLSLGGLIALISQAATVVSNDSAPIHIAGAFDTGIILIPTCKHPDHLLPWRHGSQAWRAQALYRRLVIDDCKTASTEVHTTSAEFLPRPWEEYLPKPGEVIGATAEMYYEIIKTATEVKR